MDADNDSLISRLKHSFTPDVSLADLESAWSASLKAIDVLAGLRCRLACDGMSLVHSLWPDYTPRFDVPQCVDSDPKEVQEYFRIEHECLMSRADLGHLSSDLKLLDILADLIGELATGQKRVSAEHHILTGLFPEVGFWSNMMPPWLVKTPSSAEGRAIVGKWNSGRGLGDLRELNSRAQNAMLDVEGRLDSVEQRRGSIGKGRAGGANTPRQRRLYRFRDC